MKKQKPLKKTVHVEACDIERGKPGSATSCPIARAVRRQHASKRGVSVGRDDVVVGSRGETRRHPAVYALPAKASRFVGRFDEGKPVRPFSFVMTRFA